MIKEPNPVGITAIEPAVRPPLSKTRTTDRQNSFSPTQGGQSRNPVSSVREGTD